MNEHIYMVTLAEWQHRANLAADRWARGLSDAQPPGQYVTAVQVPADTADAWSVLRRREDGR